MAGPAVGDSAPAHPLAPFVRPDDRAGSGLGTEVDHPLGRGSLLFAVGDVNDAQAFVSEAVQQIEQLIAAACIDHRRRFVGDQQGRLMGQRGRDCKPLQLAAGQGRRVPIGEPVEADPIELPVDIRSPFGWEAPHDVVADPSAEHLRLRALEHDCGAVRLPEPDAAGTLHGPGRRWRPGKDAGKRRLAGAVGSLHGDELAALDVHRHAVDGGPACSGVAIAHISGDDRDGTRREGVDHG